MAKNKFYLTFCGGVGSVTGANFMLEDGEGKERILVDCGMYQGSRFCDERNYEPFPYDPKTISCLLVTHAHMDHIGLIPKLVRGGFSGKIISTPPTKDIAAVALEDSLGILERETKHHKTPELYNRADIDKALSLWETKDYHEVFQLGELSVRMLDAGHILGSAMYEISHDHGKIVFTGDIGNSPSPLLRDTEDVADANYLVMESVYGDRNHEDRDNRRERLEDVIEKTTRRGGTLLIPAFSIERTQELLYEIENMIEKSEIPMIPVFLDSPMAIKVSDIYVKYSGYLNDNVQLAIHQGDGLFKFPQFHETMSTEESKTIEQSNKKKIIIAGSGMSNGGRIVHHEKIYLSDPKSTLLLIGYQGVGSLGRMIQDGSRSVRIMGEEVVVNASVEQIHGYSAHRDSGGLVSFVDRTGDTLRKCFVAMGEPKSSLYLVQRLRDYLGVDASMPQINQKVEIIL